MDKIDSETRFIWKLIWHILIFPYTIILVIQKKKDPKELLNILKDIHNFVFSAKFTISIVMITFFTSLLAAFTLEPHVFSYFMNHPSDLQDPSRFFSFVTNGFLHASPAHLIGNIIAIFIFGRVVERKLGSYKTALIYFGAMITANIGSSAINLYVLNVNIPGIGASGALMGLVAAAMLIDPFYLTYEFIFPVPIMILAWVTIYADIAGVLYPMADGIGHFAHIFGYLSVTFTMYFLGSYDAKRLRRGLAINIGSFGLIGLLYLGVITF